MNTAVILGVIRHLLTLAGGAGVMVSDNDIQTAVSSAITLGSIVWSIYEKIKTARSVPKE